MAGWNRDRYFGESCVGSGLLRFRVLGTGVVVLLSALCAPLLAAEPAAAMGTSPTTAAATPAKQGPQAKQVPKDPENQRGISPFWERIAQGDTAAIAHDLLTARSHYQAALSLEPKNAVGHLRLVEMLLKEGSLEGVDDHLAAALRFAGAEAELTVKALFLGALVEERRGAWAAAMEAFSKCKAQAALSPALGVYVATADARLALLKQKLETEAVYEAVRARIQRNVATADEATGAQAASNP